MTSKLIATALLGLGLLVAGPMSHPIQAQEKAAAPKSKAAGGLRECRAKGTGGKVLTWKCKSEQPCCYNASTNQGVCGSPVIGCF